MRNFIISLWSNITILLILTCLTFPPISLGKETSKEKAAIVNGSVITEEDLNREMGILQKRLLNEGKSLGQLNLSKMEQKVLESLIDMELLYQETQKKGIKVDDAEITQKIKEIKERFPGEDEFKIALKNMNYSEEALKLQIKKNLAIQQLIDDTIVQSTTITEKEAKSYYDDHQDAFKKPEQVRASHILIKADSQADASHKNAAKKKLDNIRQRLQQNGDFAALAKKFSEGPSGAKGGDLGFFGRGQMVKPFEDAAFSLKPGEISDVVETRFGYHLIKVIDKKPERTIPYDEVQEKLHQYLKQKEVREKVNLHVKELKGKAKVERFLKEDRQQ